VNRRRLVPSVREALVVPLNDHDGVAVDRFELKNAIPRLVQPASSSGPPPLRPNDWRALRLPEGCAGILWKSAEHKAKAAHALRMRSGDLKEFGIVDAVIEEPPGGAHRDPRQMATKFQTFLLRTLRELVAQPADALVAARYETFRRMGVFLEADTAG